MKLYTIYYYFQRFGLESIYLFADSEEEALTKFKQEKNTKPYFIKVDGVYKSLEHYCI